MISEHAEFDERYFPGLKHTPLTLLRGRLDVTWQVGTAKENAAAKLRATVARDLTARVRSKQLCY